MDLKEMGIQVINLQGSTFIINAKYIFYSNL